MRPVRWLLVALALLHGCAADCTSSNWRERGYADGFAGHLAQDLRLAQYCPGFSGAAYRDGYRDGYDEWDRTRGSIGVD